MVWTLFMLTFLVLLFENALDFRSMKTLERRANRTRCAQRLLRRHVLVAAFLAWGSKLLGIMNSHEFAWVSAFLFVAFMLFEIRAERSVLKGLKLTGWMVLTTVILGFSAVLFFELMDPWLLIVMSAFGFVVFIALFDRFHARFIERLARVVPFFHRMDDATFLGGLAFQERAHMLDIKALSNMRNAMIVGLFVPRRLYLSKAMLKTMRSDEVEGIIAHEVGHIRHRHILTRLVFAGIALSVFIASGLLVFQQHTPNQITYTALFTSWYLLGTLFRVLIVRLMQHQEYDADSYAKGVGKGEALQSALGKLKRQEEEQGSPLRALLHDTHPSIEKRRQRLSNKERI